MAFKRGTGTPADMVKNAYLLDPQAGAFILAQLEGQTGPQLSLHDLNCKRFGMSARCIYDFAFAKWWRSDGCDPQRRWLTKQYTGGDFIGFAETRCDFCRRPAWLVFSARSATSYLRRGSGEFKTIRRFPCLLFGGDQMRRPVDQSKVQEYQQHLTDRQNERLARLQEQQRQAEQERGDRGTFDLKDDSGNVIPHRNE